jgi:hypothetical protein
MAHLNHKDPEEKRPGLGRKLGLCVTKEKNAQSAIQYDPEQGMGKARRTGSREGKGLRNRSSARMQ